MNFSKERKSLFNINKRFSHIVYTFIACLSVFILIVYFGSTIQNTQVINNKLLHIFFEIFLLIISASIFLVTNYTYPQTKNNRLLIVGYIFLIGGLIHWYNIIESINCSINSNCNNLCMIVRLINSISFSLLIIIKFYNKRVIKRSFLFSGAIIFVALSILIERDNLLDSIFFLESSEFTITSILITIFNSLLYLYALVYTLREYKKANEFASKILSCAFIILFFSELSLLTIQVVYDRKSIISLIYLAISYCLLFYSIYIYSIRRPYVLLSKANEKLDAYLIKMDRLVDTRTRELRDMYEKLIADQEMARGIQNSMLPREMPKDDFIKFSAGYLPAEELSGDFYYVFKLDEVRYGICIGDVSGHGVPAAMLSIFAFQKMQSLMEDRERGEVSTPSMVLQHLYESFNSSNFSDDLYFVMLYGVINTQTGIFSYSSGGLNTVPLRVRPDGSIQELDNDGYAICKLGNILKPKFVNYQILLFPGDKLILYTDGLVDARNPDNQEYSLTRLKAIIGENVKYGIEYLSESIIKEANEFTNHNPADDITLLIMDVLPPF